VFTLYVRLILISFLDKSKEKSLSSDPKTPTTLRVVTDKLSKRVPLLKLPIAFSEEKTSTMSWNDQVAAKKGSNIVSGAENVPKSTQILQVPMLELLNIIHGSAESSSLLGNQIL